MTKTESKFNNSVSRKKFFFLFVVLVWILGLKVLKIQIQIILNKSDKR